MRRLRKYMIAVLFIMTVLPACKKELPIYNQKDGNAIGFAFERYRDSTLSLSFLYENEEIKRMTGYIDVRTIGFVTNYDRKVTIRQVKVEGEYNGVAGVHYLPLTDSEIADKYVIKAGEATARLPIVFLRDATMLDNLVKIRFEIVENDDFTLGMSGNLVKNVIVTDMPVKPAGWVDFTWGPYGLEKHRFMIASTGKKWDADWLTLIGLDSNERTYWHKLVVQELAKRNKEVGKELTEANGTVVKFSF